MTNLDVLGFVPLGCVVRGATFYDKTAIKASFPFIVIILLQFFPLSKRLRGEEPGEATRTVKRLTLLLLEVTLPSIATSLVQVHLQRHICNLFFDIIL